MAEIKNAEKAILIIALMYQNKSDYDKTKSVLTDKFGEIESESREFKFSITDYYKKEFGTGLVKRFISFKRLIDKEELSEFKTYSNPI